MINKIQVKAFSMVEVVVAAVVLATTIAVVFGTIMASRKPMVQADKNVRASIFAKKVMAHLRGQVDANTWDAAGSELNPDGAWHASLNEDGFQANYKVITDPSGTRKVEIKINW